MPLIELTFLIVLMKNIALRYPEILKVVLNVQNFATKFLNNISLKGLELVKNCL